MTGEDSLKGQRPALSVVIPTWNGIDLLRRNLPSVLEAQRYLELEGGLSSELIIVDDASGDDTVRAPAPRISFSSTGVQGEQRRLFEGV